MELKKKPFLLLLFGAHLKTKKFATSIKKKTLRLFNGTLIYISICASSRIIYFNHVKRIIMTSAFRDARTLAL